MNSPSLLRVLAGESLSPPPVWIMRQAGRYLPEYRALRAKAGSFLDLCFTPELAAEVTLQPARRFDLDAAIIFSDILVVPFALGQSLWFEEGSGPKLEPLEGAADLDRLQGGQALEKLQPVMQALSLVREQLPAKTALIGFAGAPWTVASYMIEGGASKDFAKAKTWAYRDPEGFQALLDLLIDTTVDYLGAQVDAGAQLVKLFDSWSGVWSQRDHVRWCLEPARRIAQGFKARHPLVPFMHFPRGAGLYYQAYGEVTEIDALALDTTVPLGWAVEALGAKKALQGNLDPLLLLGKTDELQRQTGHILDAMKGQRHIFNLGHGITPKTDPDRLAFLLRLIRGQSQKEGQ